MGGRGGGQGQRGEEWGGGRAREGRSGGRVSTGAHISGSRRGRELGGLEHRQYCIRGAQPLLT